MEELVRIAQRSTLPEGDDYLSLIERVNRVLGEEDPEYRPRDDKNRPGGLIYLKDLPTIVVPDLHGRMDFILRVLNYTPGEVPVFQLLQRGQVQVVCVGDGFHGEARAAERWKRAFKEFVGHYRKHRDMDEEMRESLGLMEMVMRLKVAFPEYFHFLKGNHENILNEEGRGNHPFRKFAYEGQMVLEWVRKFYGEEFLENYAWFEHELPLIAADRTFMISHAEPERAFTREEVIRYRAYEDVVLGLTWTPDEEAREGSVERMIHTFCTEPAEAVYFGGHRPVSGLFNLRAKDRYIQIHNPASYIIADLKPGRVVDPGRDIIELPEMLPEILSGMVKEMDEKHSPRREELHGEGPR